ncbi:MAG: ADOP family duplicated permease [Acidobacteriia bacterium]|nr:ADOP family duplicated permease [Terriglobia bacterium]
MRRLFLKLVRRRRLNRDLESELAFHREMAAAQGNSIPLGNTAAIKEQAFDLWRFNWVENLWRDIAYAARALGRSPGLVLSALLSLGLGIGVNTAMFSIAVEFLLSEPSVTDARSVTYVRLGGNSHADPKVVEFLRQSNVFQDVAGENEETYLNWNDGRETHPVFAVEATKNYFTALGIPVARGRGWMAGDPSEVAVLSHQFWRKQFHGDPSILGRAMQLDGRAYTVIGILPEAHRTLIGYGFSPDVYVPRYLDDTPLAIYARRKPGMSVGEARAALRTLAGRLDGAFPQPYKYRASVKMTAIGGLARLGDVEEMMTAGLFFAVLLTVVGLVLLIACINVAGLLLARSSARRREIAIRLSLGASRGRLFQQLLAEGLVLSLAGTALGFALALGVARFLASVPLPIPMPFRLHIEPDWRVVAYAAILAILTTIASGLTPAWQSVKDSLTRDLHRARKLRLRRGLVVAQIAVSFVVLAAGALFLENLLHSAAISPGFDVRRTLRAEVHLPPARYADKRRIELYVEQALRQLEAIPGIEAAAAARIVPFTDNTQFNSGLTFTDNGEEREAAFHWNAVSPGFFRAMDIPILAGRAFHWYEATPAVMVNSAFVKRYLGARDPVGCRFLWGAGKAPYQIVGVVRGTKNLTIGEGDIPQLYQPFTQIEEDRPRLQFVLRSATPPAAQLAAVRQVLRRLEPAAGLEVATLFSSVGLAFLPSRIGAVLMGGIGLLGLLLAAIGLYGVLAYSVTGRTQEIGIRIAVGATGREISRMILLEAGRLLAVGSALGFAIALIVTRPLSLFLVPGLSPSDPLSFAAVIVVLAGAGLLASLGPARRAIAVDLMRCLRYE